mmetsp:Transcript_35281/g.80610  ORF Transcript_35281/g.80610 Transcript_35281/m.80610 type:complete len:402 (-) Transcript_35281:502-1707(-)|eukprot:CAMPEP_0114562188 /NCGR_PEP_ID=MMETSP0114-20121206/12392_1 /TAXON_ID=31324 /ORGANISM="Goniomonas sp, Strain m" /LENGTH=401 /DNA_ID=CAMNT_0001747849 /DNA_START=78 /DNA_END=1283 /DNA_ORIENTATION=+
MAHWVYTPDVPRQVMADPQCNWFSTLRTEPGPRPSPTRRAQSREEPPELSSKRQSLSQIFDQARTELRTSQTRRPRSQAEIRATTPQEDSRPQTVAWPPKRKRPTLAPYAKQGLDLLKAEAVEIREDRKQWNIVNNLTTLAAEKQAEAVRLEKIAQMEKLRAGFDEQFRRMTEQQRRAQEEKLASQKEFQEKCRLDEQRAKEEKLAILERNKREAERVRAARLQFVAQIKAQVQESTMEGKKLLTHLTVSQRQQRERERIFKQRQKSSLMEVHLKNRNQIEAQTALLTKEMSLDGARNAADQDALKADYAAYLAKKKQLHDAMMKDDAAQRTQQREADKLQWNRQMDRYLNKYQEQKWQNRDQAEAKTKDSFNKIVPPLRVTKSHKCGTPPSRQASRKARA